MQTFDAPKILRRTLPERLRAARLARGWSQSALAKRAGVSASTLSDIEAGFAKDLKLSTILRLCGQLRLRPDDLLGTHDDRGIASLRALCVSLLPGAHFVNSDTTALLSIFG